MPEHHFPSDPSIHPKSAHHGRRSLDRLKMNSHRGELGLLAATALLLLLAGTTRPASAMQLPEDELYSSELVALEKGTASCVENDDTLCLLDSRFEVTVSWDDGQGGSGEGQVVPTLSKASGLFYFFQQDNWEILVKTIKACVVNQHYWVYAAATTDREYELSVVDTSTGAEKVYRNELGQRAPAVADNKAFPCAEGGSGTDATAALHSGAPGLAGQERGSSYKDTRAWTAHRSDSSTDLLGIKQAVGAVFTVGPAGSYGSLQEALDAVVAGGGEGDVRVQVGTLEGTTVVDNSNIEFGLTISGGWNSAFTERSLVAGDTVLDGKQAGSVLSLGAGNGSIRVEGLRLTGGREIEGGGLKVEVFGSASAQILNLEVDSNEVTGPNSVAGGGVYLTAFGSSEIFFTDSFVHHNFGVEGSISGGGLSGTVGDSSIMYVRRNRIEDNETNSGTNQGTGSGAFLNSQGESLLRFTDNVIVGNRHLGTSSCVGSSLAFWQSDASDARARRNVITDSAAPNTSFCQSVSVLASDIGISVFTDSLIATGDRFAVRALSFQTGDLVLANLTIADHPQGIAGSLADGTLTVANNAFNQVAEALLFTTPGIVEIANLVLPDSAFRDPAAGDYRPTSTSAAVDAGSKAIDDLGPLDLDRNPRILGGGVDVGAYEFVVGPCVADEQTLCLLGGRFEVKVAWKDYNGGTGPGREVDPANLLVPSDDSGLFYFFEADNWEFLVKIIDACAFNQRFWVYAAATTDVEYTLSVRDTQTGEAVSYFNPLGTRSPAITDSGAFATCQ